MKSETIRETRRRINRNSNENALLIVVMMILLILSLGIHINGISYRTCDCDCDCEYKSDYAQDYDKPERVCEPDIKYVYGYWRMEGNPIDVMCENDDAVITWANESRGITHFTIDKGSTCAVKRIKCEYK